jgi:hypothetical protein
MAGKNGFEAGHSQKPYTNGHSHPMVATLTGIKLPDGFIFNDRGNLIHQIEVGQGGDAKDVLISEHPIYLSGVFRSEAGSAAGRVYAFQQWHPYHGWNAIALPAGQLHTPAGLALLADGGANIREPVLFRSMVMQHIDNYNHAGNQPPCHEQLGWKLDEHGNRVAFLLGTGMFHVGGACTQSLVTPELQHRATEIGAISGGDFREWRRIVSQIIPDYDYAGQLNLLFSLASVLISWMVSDESGGIVNNREIGSGQGKTTRLKCAMLMWGQWHALRFTNYDTRAFRGFTATRLNHLPMAHDELDKLIKNKDLQPIFEHIMDAGEGTDRGRMEQGGKRTVVQVTKRNNIEMSASNLSLVDVLEAHGGTDAALQRVLEMVSRSPQHLDPTYAEELLEEMKLHAGTAGMVFLKHLLQPEVMKFTAKRLSENRTALYKETGFRQRDRFKVRLIAAAMTVGELCEQIGGYFWFDYRKAVAWLLGQLKVIDKTNDPDKIPDGGDGVEAIRQFFMQHSRDVLHVAGPYNPAAEPFHVAPHDRPAGKLMIRVESATQRAYITYKDFQRFCAENGFSTQDCLKHLERIKYVIRHDRQVNLSAGTNLISARARCLEIDTAHELSSSLPDLG